MVAPLSVQRVERRRHQWAVLNDFLLSVVGEKMLVDVFSHLKHGTSFLSLSRNVSCTLRNSSAFQRHYFADES